MRNTYSPTLRSVDRHLLIWTDERWTPWSWSIPRKIRDRRDKYLLRDHCICNVLRYERYYDRRHCILRVVGIIVVQCSVYFLVKRAANRSRSKISLRKMRICYTFRLFINFLLYFRNKKTWIIMNRGPIYGFRAFYDEDKQE